jgi:alpha-L-fucosidase
MNVGPMANGKLRTLDTAMLVTLGEWIDKFSEACVGTLPTKIEVSGDDFVMQGRDAYYLFCHELPMGGNRHVALTDDQREGYSISLNLDKKIKSITWLESGDAVEYKETECGVKLYPTPQPYGQSVVVRIAKIITE